MRIALALVIALTACTRQPKPAQPTADFQSGIGQWHATRGPSDPNMPLAKDPEVTEGGGRISMAPVGPVTSPVTQSVSEQPSTVTTNNGQPAIVVAPTVAPPVAPPIVNPPGTTTAPVNGPVAGAGPNGPGTGTGPATPTGPGTGAGTPTPSNPGPTAGTGPRGSTPGTR